MVCWFSDFLALCLKKSKLQLSRLSFFDLSPSISLWGVAPFSLAPTAAFAGHFCYTNKQTTNGQAVHQIERRYCFRIICSSSGQSAVRNDNMIPYAVLYLQLIDVLWEFREFHRISSIYQRQFEIFADWLWMNPHRAINCWWTTTL